MTTDSTSWSLTAAALDLVCPRCEALPGQECRTINGARAEMHVRRWNPLNEAWVAGFDAGAAYAKRIAARRAGRA